MDHDFKKEGYIMNQVELNAFTPLHKTGHTSKGDQRKWKLDDIWYKADYMGYESLAEVLVSTLLGKSSLPYSRVLYQYIQIEYRENKINGCSSRNFLHQDQILIPLEKLYRQYTGESLAVRLSEFTDVSEKIQFLVGQTEEITSMEKIEAKPFHSDFDVQLKAAEELYGNQIKFAFTIKDVQEILKQFEEIYPAEIRKRVEIILRQQIRKYSYLMKR